MSWKNWSYSKKGGILGGFLVFISIWIANIIKGDCISLVQTDWCGNLEAAINLANIVLAVLLGLIGLVLGLITGWTIGKIKSRMVE